MKTLLLTLLFFFSFSSVGFASSPPEVSNGGILPGPSTTEVSSDSASSTPVQNKGGQTYIIQKLIPMLTSGFVAFIMSLSILMIIIAGLMYVFSAGDSETMQKAKSIVFWTLVGAGIAIISFAMVKFVIGINFSGPTP